MKQQLEQLQVYSAGMSEAALKKKTGYTGSFTKLASNENPIGPTKKVQEAIIKALQSGLDLSEYPDSEATELKEALANFYGIQSEQVFVGAGLDEVIMMISRAMLTPGGEILTSEGTFVQYNTHAIIEANQIVTVPLNQGRFDLDAFLPKISDKTGIIWICNPNNPTGTYVDVTTLVNFLKQVPAHIPVVLDEAYFEFVDAPDFPNALQLQKQFKNIIILRTFSKAYGLASFRVGYAITSKENVDVWNKVKLPFNVTTLSLIAAEIALKDQAALKIYVKMNKEEREKYFNSKVSEHFLPSQTNFIFVKTNDPESLNQLLLQHGIIARQMPIGVRITIGKPEDNDIVIRALESFFKA